MSLFDLPYNLYVLFFGMYVSLRIACGPMNTIRWRVFSVLSPALLLLQGGILQLFGADAVRMSYPLTTHLPLALAMIFLLHIRPDAALVSVAISYSMCQLLRWAGFLVGVLPLAPAVHVIVHLCCCLLILCLLDRFCLPALHRAAASLHNLLLLLGTLPIIYYLYDYFMLFTSGRYTGVLLISELLPTGMVLFFVLFVVAYQREVERRRQAQQQAAALSLNLTHAGQEILALRLVEEKTAVYRHDMRHHLLMISGLLAGGKQEQALAYIQDVQNSIDAITPQRLCDNETVNLLLCAFKARAEKLGVSLETRAQLPDSLCLPDTELCILLSNGLENALNAASRLPNDAKRSVHVFCGMRQGSLLIEIRNSFAGSICM